MKPTINNYYTHTKTKNKKNTSDQNSMYFSYDYLINIDSNTPSLRFGAHDQLLYLIIMDIT